MPNSLQCLFKVRTGVLSKTLSYIWGKLNLPIFLFNEGLFTLMNMDSLIFLAKPCEIAPSMMIMLCVRFNIIFNRSVLLSAEFTSESVYIQHECHLLLCSDRLS